MGQSHGPCKVHGVQVGEPVLLGTKKEVTEGSDEVDAPCVEDRGGLAMGGVEDDVLEELGGHLDARATSETGKEGLHEMVGQRAVNALDVAEDAGVDGAAGPMEEIGLGTGVWDQSPHSTSHFVLWSHKREKVYMRVLGLW